MNLCSNKDILLWDIVRDGEVYYMNITLKGFFKLRPIAKKTGIRVAVLQRYGLAFPHFHTRPSGGADLSDEILKIPDAADAPADLHILIRIIVNGKSCPLKGVCSLILGGGRETKQSEIDLSVGIVLQKKVGDAVKEGDTLAVIEVSSAPCIPEYRDNSQSMPPCFRSW